MRYNEEKKGNLNLQLPELWVSLKHTMLCPGHLKHQAHSLRFLFFLCLLLALKQALSPPLDSFLEVLPAAQHITYLLYIYSQSPSPSENEFIYCHKNEYQRIPLAETLHFSATHMSGAQDYSGLGRGGAGGAAGRCCSTVMAGLTKPRNAYRQSLALSSIPPADSLPFLNFFYFFLLQ